MAELIVIPDIARAAIRPAVIVDDVISTGHTLAKCAKLLVEVGATTIDALAVNCLAEMTRSP